MLRRLRRVAELLEQDADTDLTPLHERDRAIGSAMFRPRAAPHRQILRWAALRDPQWAEARGPGTSALGLVLGVLGALLGVAACAGALYFEGGGRVNVVSLLGLLVGLQLLSLLFTLLAMLPQGVRRRVPGLRGLAESLGLLSPARAVLGLLRRGFPGAVDAVDLAGGSARRDLRLFARARRWLLWRLSQGFAVAFNLGILACFMAMVVFTDLAFGWSTTLDVEPSAMHALVELVASPWSRVYPRGVPSAALVEASRFFRAGSTVGVDPELLGQWWRFVLAALLCYGLLPRLFLWLFARWRCARAERWTLLHLPGASELLYRLNNEVVTTHGRAEACLDPLPEQHAGSASVVPVSGSCTLVLWGDFETAPEEIAARVRAASTLDPVQVQRAGGSRAPDQDRGVIDALAAAGRPVAIAVKSWEPPLADFTDFLQELRGFCEESRALVVVPVPQPGASAPERGDVAVWRARLSRLGDPLAQRACRARGGAAVSAPVLAVVGHPNKGKSSIVATLAHDPSVRISSEPGTTTHTRSYPMRVDGELLYTLADTPGFQRARRVLAWLREHNDAVAARPQAVREFLSEHAGSGRYQDECELLAPIMEGAGILYVVDGSKPYGAEYEAEMEILRWTGRPRMALVNPIGGEDHVEPWRTALDQYFNVVRVFNAMSADFVRQTALLRSFGELQEGWREPFETAVRVLTRDRARRHGLAARGIAEMLAQMIVLSLSEDCADDAQASAVRSALESRHRDRLRELEEGGRRAVERIYDHVSLHRREAAFAAIELDLFDTRTWTLFGLTPAQLALTGALGGAVLGVGVDAALGGASLFLGSAVGAAVGAASAWLGGGSLAEVKVSDRGRLGGVRITVGPVKNPNFPYVVLGRALHHQRLVALRTHAQRDALEIDTTEAARWVAELHEGLRKDLERCFRALRDGDDSITDSLAELLASLTPAVDRQTPEW